MVKAVFLNGSEKKSITELKEKDIIDSKVTFKDYDLFHNFTFKIVKTNDRDKYQVENNKNEIVFTTNSLSNLKKILRDKSSIWI